MRYSTFIKGRKKFYEWATWELIKPLCKYTSKTGTEKVTARHNPEEGKYEVIPGKWVQLTYEQAKKELEPIDWLDQVALNNYHNCQLFVFIPDKTTNHEYKKPPKRSLPGVDA